MVQHLPGTTTSNSGGAQSSGPLSPLPQSTPDASPGAPVQHSSSVLPTPVNLSSSLSSQSNSATDGTSTNPCDNDSNPFVCEFCHSRPKLSDGSKLHPYCGKRCANRARKKDRASAIRSQPSQAPLADANCDFCLDQPKYFDGKKTHPFCSKTCAKNAGGLTNGAARRLSMFLGAQPPIAAVTCRMLNCPKPVYVNADGSLGEYCSMAHKTLGENFCIMCLQAPKAIMSHFCSQECTDKVEDRAPAVLESSAGHVTLRRLDPTDPDYRNFKRQFNDGWRHPQKKKLKVRVIFRIILPPDFYVGYFRHRDRVLGDKSDNLPSEQLLFHGTNRACSLGEGRENTNLCQQQDCSLCCIIRKSFDISKCGTKNSFCRFGTGIYTSSVSSKADDYVQNLDGSTTTRALLLNRVIVGNSMFYERSAPNLQSPPPGYHSVVGKPGVDSVLNYEETVVYNNDAVRPAFLIIYGEKPKLKLREVIQMLLNAPLVS